MRRSTIASLLLAIILPASAVLAAGPPSAAKAPSAAAPARDHSLRVEIPPDLRTPDATHVDVHADSRRGLTFVVRDDHGKARRSLGIRIVGSRTTIAFQSATGRGSRVFEGDAVVGGELPAAVEPEVQATLELVAELPTLPPPSGGPTALAWHDPPGATGNIVCDWQGAVCYCTCSHDWSWLGIAGCAYFKYASLLDGESCATHDITCSANGDECSPTG